MKALKQLLFVMSFLVLASFNMSFTSTAASEKAVIETSATSAVAAPGVYLGRWTNVKNPDGTTTMKCVKTPDPWNCVGFQIW